MSEWNDVVDAWQLDRWEAYRDFKRLGRKTRLAEKQRLALWEIFKRVRLGLQSRGLMTRPMLYWALARHYAGGAKSPFDHVVVDEART